MYLKKKSKQAGYSLVELLITLAISGWILIGIAKILNDYSIRSQAELMQWRIQHIANAMQRYYTDRVISGSPSTDIDNYPESIEELKASPYLLNCSHEDSALGECVDFSFLPYGQTEFGEPIKIVRLMTSGYPEFQMQFSLAPITNDLLFRYFKKELTKLPGYTFDSATEKVTLYYQRPANVVSMENKVSRDGSTPMTADWDYGGFDLNNIRYINQVEDISIKGVTDRTVLTGLRNTGSVKISNSSGVSVTKPACPVDYEPRIEVWKIGLGTDVVIYEPRNDIAWYVDNNATWKVMYKVSGKTSPNAAASHTWLYNGVVGYSTWCGL